MAAGTWHLAPAFLYCEEPPSPKTVEGGHRRGRKGRRGLVFSSKTVKLWHLAVLRVLGIVVLYGSRGMRWPCLFLGVDRVQLVDGAWC